MGMKRNEFGNLAHCVREKWISSLVQTMDGGRHSNLYRYG